MALERIGYARARSRSIVAGSTSRNGVVGRSRTLKTEHYPIFDCAVASAAIHYLGHVR